MYQYWLPMVKPHMWTLKLCLGILGNRKMHQNATYVHRCDHPTTKKGQDMFDLNVFYFDLKPWWSLWSLWSSPEKVLHIIDPEGTKRQCHHRLWSQPFTELLHLKEAVAVAIRHGPFLTEQTPWCALKDIQNHQWCQYVNGQWWLMMVDYGWWWLMMVNNQ